MPFMHAILTHTALLSPATALQPKDWSIKMNKKERRLALATALQSAAADTVVVESVAVPDGKTKSLVTVRGAQGMWQNCPCLHPACRQGLG